jgi:hypothetical protein
LGPHFKVPAPSLGFQSPYPLRGDRTRSASSCPPIAQSAPCNIQPAKCNMRHASTPRNRTINRGFRPYTRSNPTGKPAPNSGMRLCARIGLPLPHRLPDWARPAQSAPGLPRRVEATRPYHRRRRQRRLDLRRILRHQLKGGPRGNPACNARRLRTQRATPGMARVSGHRLHCVPTQTCRPFPCTLVRTKAATAELGPQVLIQKGSLWIMRRVLRKTHRQVRSYEQTEPAIRVRGAPQQDANRASES